MFISFDYKCTRCEDIDSRMVKRVEMDEQTCNKPDCFSAHMIRLPAGTRTTFRFADRKLKD